MTLAFPAARRVRTTTPRRGPSVPNACRWPPFPRHAAARPRLLDALLARCMEPGRHPALREIVVAGHSGGAQAAHRHAIVGRAAADCRAQGVGVRHVIANPASYVYFDAFRPCPAACGASCPGVNDWKHGVLRPPRSAAQADFVALAQRYAQSDVTCLLGGNDDDPRHPAPDRSCAAAAQGPHRLARGRAYFATCDACFRPPVAYAARSPALVATAMRCWPASRAFRPCSARGRTRAGRPPSAGRRAARRIDRAARRRRKPHGPPGGCRTPHPPAPGT
ncbi:MAG: hypothetical protein ACRYHA_16050 [Janthinobacterium lividum]